jgi:ribosomal protein S18 acetylase RimI-like enzyme
MHIADIRRIKRADLDQINTLITTVVREQYDHLLPDVDIKIDPIEIQSGGWAAHFGDRIIGVGIAEHDTIDDLWLLGGFRGLGIGSALLSALETQIREHGYTKARLRVVAENQSARRFYARRGCQEKKSYPHEK